jgi:putative flippase GtrA
LSSLGNSTKSLPQAIRYLLVGGFNTIFGYALFAVLNLMLQPLGSYSYMLASFLANLIAITVAFLGYKWFVFKTHGNYLREWMRCLAVYSTGMFLTLAGLPILVTLIHHMLRPQKLAPYIAAAIMAVVTAALSFFGHKHFSFGGQNLPQLDPLDRRSRLAGENPMPESVLAEKLALEGER